MEAGKNHPHSHGSEITNRPDQVSITSFLFGKILVNLTGFSEDQVLMWLSIKFCPITATVNCPETFFYLKGITEMSQCIKFNEVLDSFPQLFMCKLSCA